MPVKILLIMNNEFNELLPAELEKIGYQVTHFTHPDFFLESNFHDYDIVVAEIEFTDRPSISIVSYFDYVKPKPICIYIHNRIFTDEGESLSFARNFSRFLIPKFNSVDEFIIQIKAQICTPKVLTVDDSKLDLQINTILIRKFGYLVNSILGGRTALELDNLIDYEIICTDVQMPVMNGYEFIEHCKTKHPSACYFLVSSSINENDIKRARNMGSNVLFLNKPLTLPDLKNIENTFLEKITGSNPERVNQIRKIFRY